MIEYEIVKHDRIHGVRVLVNTIRIRSVHMHHDTELLYVIRGSGTVIIRNRSFSLSENDGIIINAYESHEILSNESDFTLIIIQFSGHFLQDYSPIRNVLFPEENLIRLLSENEMNRLREEIYDLSISYLEAEGYFRLYCVSRLSGILFRVLNNIEAQVLDEAEYAKRRKSEKRMKRISEYIEQNYQDPIRLSDIAEQEGITVTHLSHLIREQFGMSFQEYLKNKRLENAVRMIHTQRTLSEISALCGFSELKYMTKAFQEAFQMTPAEYRRMEAPAVSRNKSQDSSEYIYSRWEALRLLKETRHSERTGAKSL